MELVDTDVLIDIQRGHPPAVTWIASLTALPSVPGFAVMELIQDARNAGEVRQALKLVAPFSVIWPTDADCNRALSDFTSLHLSHGLGLLDALIASCAVGLSATLLTFNDRHFRVVPGLTIVKPYIR
jgi:predicted nucleic acid-binding protein